MVFSLLLGNVFQRLTFLWSRMMFSQAGDHLTSLHTPLFWLPSQGLSRKSLSKSKLYYDRRSVGKSDLVSGTHLGPRPIFLILYLIIFRQLRFLEVERPLWREVGSYNFQFLPASPAQPFSDLSPTGLRSIFYCLYFWDSPNMEGQGPVFISPRNRVAQLYPWALGLSN
jgi:hypothetical protein